MLFGVVADQELKFHAFCALRVLILANEAHSGGHHLRDTENCVCVGGSSTREGGCPHSRYARLDAGGSCMNRQLGGSGSTDRSV